jgi:small multidrug resistance pump
MALYMLSGLGFVIAMRHMSLATVGVWYAVLTVLMMTALGVLVFNEDLATREVIGIILAVVSLLLMTRFA